MDSLYLTFVFYFLALNLFCFGLFGIDKHRAIKGDWRIPESTLLLIAAAGGVIGALCGQQYFKHKTRKRPFRSILLAIAFTQSIFIIMFGLPGFRVEILTFLLRNLTTVN